MAGAILYLASLVVITQNVILFLGAGFGWDWPPTERIKFGMVVVGDLALVGSSLLGAIWFYQRGRRGWGTLLASNLGILALAFVVRSRGLRFPPWAFAAIDLYWLQLYLLMLMRHYPDLRANPPPPRPAAATPAAPTPSPAHGKEDH